MGCGTEDKTITYVRKSIRTNKNRRKQWKTHRKCVTLASMQSKCRNTHGTKTIHRCLNEVYTFRPFTDLGTPPHPPGVWKIGIFHYILVVSPATKKADLGGIDIPPSVNYLVVHNPAKCSLFLTLETGARLTHIVQTVLPVSTPVPTVSFGYFLLLCRFSLCFLWLLSLLACSRVVTSTS